MEYKLSVTEYMVIMRWCQPFKGQVPERYDRKIKERHTGAARTQNKLTSTGLIR